MDLNDLITQYLIYLEERGASVAHRITVEWRLRRFVRYLDEQGEMLELSALQRIHLVRFFREMEERYADGTLAGWASTHRSFWKWVRKKGYVSTNLGKKLKRYSFDPVVRTSACAEDVLILVSRLDEFAAHRGYRPRDVRDALIVSFSVDCGGRRGEMWRVTRAEMERSLQRATQMADGSTIYSLVSRGKMGSCRLDYCEQTGNFARMWLSMLPACADHVFVNLTSGKLLHENTFGRVFVRVCEWVGVTPFRSHAIRKLNVSEILASADVDVAMRYAGHRDQKTTLTHYKEKRYRDVLSATAMLSSRRWRSASNTVQHDEIVRLFGRHESENGGGR